MKEQFGELPKKIRARNTGNGWGAETRRWKSDRARKVMLLRPSVQVTFEFSLDFFHRLEGLSCTNVSQGALCGVVEEVPTGWRLKRLVELASVDSLSEGFAHGFNLFLCSDIESYDFASAIGDARNRGMQEFFIQTFERCSDSVLRIDVRAECLERVRTSISAEVSSDLAAQLRVFESQIKVEKKSLQ